MIRVYCRCNSGHYFIGEHCPFDGWSSSESEAIACAARSLLDSKVTPSIHTLRKAGVSAQALARALVVEFGAEASAFDAVSPEAYVVGGEVRLLKDLELAFM